MQLTSVQDLMVMTLQELHSAETQLLGAMPDLLNAATSDELRESFMMHTRQTEGQVQRLEQALARYGEQPGMRKSRAAESLLAEARELARASGDPDVKDAALLAAQQKFEHNEIACYGTAVTFANLLGDKEAAQLLARTLDEEEKMDQQLTRLAKQKINIEASEATSA